MLWTIIGLAIPFICFVLVCICAKKNSNRRNPVHNISYTESSQQMYIHPHNASHVYPAQTYYPGQIYSNQVYPAPKHFDDYPPTYAEINKENKEKITKY